MYQFYYDIIVNKIIGSLPSGVIDDHIQQLGLILTHASIILTFVACVLFLIWLFKFCANVITLRG